MTPHLLSNIILAAVLSLFFMTVNAYAADDFFDNHAQGWHWYVPEPSVTPSKNTTLSNSASPENTRYDPLATVQAISHAVNEAKAQAVLNPTPENIARLLR